MTGIAGEVFNDLTNPGVSDRGEPGLIGRTFFLDFDRDGILDRNEYNATTSSTGGYYFPGLYEVTLLPHDLDVSTTPVVREVFVMPDRLVDVNFGILT